jgi:uncharacterized protein YlxW (UPF0749 family)
MLPTPLMPLPTLKKKLMLMPMKKLSHQTQPFLVLVVLPDAEMKVMSVNVKVLSGSSLTTNNIQLTHQRWQMEEVANKRLMDKLLALVRLLEIQLLEFQNNVSANRTVLK